MRLLKTDKPLFLIKSITPIQDFKPEKTQKIPSIRMLVLPKISGYPFLNVIEELNFDTLPFILYFTSEGVLIIKNYPVLMH